MMILAPSFQYMLIYITAFFMLEVKFSLKYKRASSSELTNSVRNLKFHLIHVCLIKRGEK